MKGCGLRKVYRRGIVSLHIKSGSDGLKRGYSELCAVGLIPARFVGGLNFIILKRLQIAVICVYLRKILEYETGKGYTCASYW